MRSMHLALDAVGIKHSGGATVLLDFLDAAVADDRLLKISIFCSPRSRRNFDLPVSDRIVEYECPLVDSSYLYRILWCQRLLAAACRRIGADVLLSMGGNSHARNLIPHVAFVQQSLPFSKEALAHSAPINAIRIPLIRWMMRRSCRTANRVICQSPTMRKWVKDAFNLDSNKVVEFISSVRPLPKNKTGAPELAVMRQVRDGQRLLYVGNQSGYKMVQTAIKGIQLIKRRIPNATLFLTLPTDHPANKMSGVVCLGYIQHEYLCEAYELATALVLPSLVESGPQTPLEAMSLGTPVLIADRPYAHDICENAAIFFDPLSEEDFADKAVELLKNESKQKEIAALGFALMEKRKSGAPYKRIIDVIWESISL